MVSPINTKEIALISVSSAVWIVAQVYFGKYLGSLTHVHGIVNRLIGWLLMVIVADLTRRFGRVTAMTAVSVLATRMARTARNPFEAAIVASGYFLGGLVFDMLFSLYRGDEKEGKKRRIFTLYILFSGLISALVASSPWLLYKISFLGFYGFLAYFLSLGAFSTAKQIVLSVLGTSIGLSILPQIRIWRIR